MPFLLELPQFKKDPLNGFFRYTLQYGDIVRYGSLFITHQLSHPDHIQQVLQSNAANYRKGRDYRILRLSLGEGLLTSEGALWQRQRKMTQPAFQSQQVASFVRVMEEHTLAMLERWERFATNGEAFDVVPELMRMTLNIASQSLFSANLESDADVIRHTLEVGRDFTVQRAWSIIPMPASLPTRRNRAYMQALANFHAIIDRMIAERRRSSEPVSDYLTLLMQARDDSGASMSDRQLRDEIATLLTAGHETTTLAVAWTLFLIAQRPDVVERMAAELSFLSGAAPGYGDLFKLKYTRQVVEESMRLYPPVWVLSRTAINDDVMSGHHIPAGSEILIFPYITHRHPKWWRDPQSFCPDRFAPENSSVRPRFAYLPFGAGPRICVGLNFAMTEILVALALVLQRFRIELAIDPAKVIANPSVTLRPDPGVPVRLRKIG